MKRILLIGYGSKLMGDDCMGPCIVESLEGEFGENVRLMSLPQLDLTLAPEMVDTDSVIFVDARSDEDETPVKTGRVYPASGKLTLNHSSHSVGIPELLRIAQDWYGAVPEGYAVMPKGYDFSFSETMTEPARSAAAGAREKVIEKLKELGAFRE